MTQDRPPIVTLVSCPMIGALGPDAQVVQRDPCETCGQAFPDEIKFLDYQFDTWEQAELIKLDNLNYAMTRRLYEKLSTADLKGLAMRAMKVSRGPIFEDLDPEGKVVIPEFVQWIIPGRADGPSGWWESKGLCPTCGRTIWKSTDKLKDALFAKYENKSGPERLVSASTWQGEDVFFLTDPGPPLVTQRFKQVLEQQKVTDLILDAAVWVD